MTSDELRKMATDDSEYQDYCDYSVALGDALLKAADELDCLTAAYTTAVEDLNVAAVQLDEKDEKLAALRRENKRLQAVADAAERALNYWDLRRPSDRKRLEETLSALRGKGEGGKV